MTARLTPAEIDALERLRADWLADPAGYIPLRDALCKYSAALIAAARNEAVLREVLKEARSILAILDHPTKSVTYLDSDRLRGATARANEIES